MLRLVFISLFFVTQSAHAIVLNVSIQCRAEGPIYEGVVEFPATLSDWTVRQTSPDKCSITTAIPLRIEFNGMKYINTAVTREVSASPGTPQNCNDRMRRYGAGMAASIYRLKNSIGFEINASLERTEDRNVLALRSFSDGIQACSIFQ